MSQSDFVTRGQALVGAGQFQEAVKVCRLGLLGRPTTVEGRVVLGQALLALKRYDEVLAEMRVALELDHASIPAQLLKGEALLRKGDPHAALDVLQRAKLQAPTDQRVASLVAEAKRGAGRPSTTAGHPAVGFLTENAAEVTRHYPNHGADEEDTSDNGEEGTGGYTRPTSLSAPGAKKRTPKPVVTTPDATPPPAVLAVGDRSGTVEVDPELDGVELEGEDDFGEIAAPPGGRTRGPLPAPGGARGQVVPARAPPTALGRAPAPAAGLAAEKLRSTVHGRAPGPGSKAALPKPNRGRKANVEISTVELEDDEMIEVPDFEPEPSRKQGGTAVRNAVSMPSGPLDAQMPMAANRPTQHEQAVAPPPHLAHMIANAPHVMQAQPIPTNPMVRNNPIAAALPTMAAQPPPPMMLPLHLQNPAAIRPTMAIAPAPQQPQPDQLFANQVANQGSPGWARATVAAVPNGGQQPHMQQQQPYAAMPQQQPYPAMQQQMPPQMQAMMQEPSTPAAVAMLLEPSQSSAKSLKTGMRKSRSRLQIVIWFLIGGLVIGGGVFAGFQIRAMRLKKQISAAREQAITLAKADTWKGWIGARDRLAGIVQASATLDNLAALARARALVAYEFGDGLGDAKGAYDQLAAQSALDVELAGAYVALAQSDAAAARAAADRALKLAPEDPAALYVTGQAALLGGDTAGAVKSLKAAVEREARPNYAVGLALAQAEASAPTEAQQAIDKALAESSDHPGALIARGQLYATSGQNTAKGGEIRGALQKLVAEGGKPPGEQQRGVSPTQVAYAHLVLARLDHGRGDIAAMTTDLRAAANVDLGRDDQRFAETAVETLFALGELEKARQTADRALSEWGNSRRIRVALARVLIAQGKPADALAVLSKMSDIKEQPPALATRGHAHLAAGDLDAARADFDAALKKLPALELAIVGRAWVDLAGGDAAAAKKRVEGKHTTSTAMGTVYAAALRMSNDPAAKESAKTLLEKIVNGPQSLELARAQLELARIYRDLGDPRAKNLYADASRAGNLDAKLENGILMIELGDPQGGKDTLDALLRGTANPNAELLLETARARMLVGDHAGATELLAQADKVPNVARWKYDRERGRLALRKGDYNGAATAFATALDTCGDDAETFMLAADVAAAEDKHAKLGEQVKTLAAKRLVGKPEGQIVTGKLLLSKGEEASKAYDAAQATLGKEKSSQRRHAQAQLGRAIVRYNLEDDPAAIDALNFAIRLDPSLYEAYLYLADITKEKDAKGALTNAQSAVRFNPDLVEGHEMVGVIAHKLGNRKLLDAAVTRLNELAPNSDRLKNLTKLQGPR